MNIPQWLAVLATILGVASILGAVIATFRASYSKARIEALREDNNDLRARVVDLEAKEERAAKDKADMMAEMTHMKEKNHILEEMVLQRVEITGIADVLKLQGELLQQHHNQSMDTWDKILHALQPWTDTLQKMKAIEGEA
jgi:hypothetical protein